MKALIIIWILVVIVAINLFAQEDTNLKWVYRHAELSEKFLDKHLYSAESSGENIIIDEAEFKLPSKSAGISDIHGKVIMHVSKNKSLGDYNGRKVAEEHIFYVLDEDEKSYYRIHEYYLASGEKATHWFKYDFAEAKALSESLVALVD